MIPPVVTAAASRLALAAIAILGATFVQIQARP
jgi:hypothetical protein